eukprot:365763-Chlamydomonas_euryale.AAC.8
MSMLATSHVCCMLHQQAQLPRMHACSPMQQQPRSAAFEYRYMTEFQSHEPEFDYLKSLEIEEKINMVRLCKETWCGCMHVDVA